MSPSQYPFPQWFQTALRRYLKAARVNRSEVAERLGVKGSTVHRWDRGLSFPDEPQQARLAALLDADEQEIGRLVRESRKLRVRDWGLGNTWSPGPRALVSA